MFDLQELHINLSLQAICEVIVKGVRQHSIYQLLDQFYETIFL